MTINNSEWESVWASSELSNGAEGLDDCGGLREATQIWSFGAGLSFNSCALLRVTGAVSLMSLCPHRSKLWFIKLNCAFPWDWWDWKVTLIPERSSLFVKVLFHFLYQQTSDPPVFLFRMLNSAHIYEFRHHLHPRCKCRGSLNLHYLPHTLWFLRQLLSIVTALPLEFSKLPLLAIWLFLCRYIFLSAKTAVINITWNFGMPTATLLLCRDDLQEVSRKFNYRFTVRDQRTARHFYRFSLLRVMLLTAISADPFLF